jgi:DNA-directed RNA polymerase specialized sigma24 family protein
MGEPEIQRDPNFATTRWTLVLHAGRPESPESLEALAELCRVYWYPLYAYVRRQGFATHAAQDLTQDFFAKLLEKNYLGVVERHRGRFRWFLLTAFKCYQANEWDRASAQKRGGGVKPISLDAMSAEERYQVEPTDHTSADLLYDRRWALDLLARSRIRLRDHFQAMGKAERFELLESFLPGEEPSASQAEIGQQLGLSENAVKQEVHRMKKRFGELLRQEVAQTVAQPEDVDEELRYLIDVVCRR